MSDKYIEFLKGNTKDIESVCELGAGIFRNFNSYQCSIKIGIELIPSYVENKICDATIAICGNALDFEELLKDIKVDAFAIIDFIEHIEKNVAVDLLQRLQLAAKRIFVFCPDGTCNQVGDEAWDFNQKHLTSKISKDKNNAIEAQRHKSTWCAFDFKNLGFQVEVDNDRIKGHRSYNIYGDDGGAVIWAVWNK